MHMLESSTCVSVLLCAFNFLFALPHVVLTVTSVRFFGLLRVASPPLSAAALLRCHAAHSHPLLSHV